MPQLREGLIDGVVLFVVLGVAVVSGFVASSIAQSKGHSGGAYFILGFFLPLIGILAAGFMAPVDSGGRSPAGGAAHPLAELRSPDDPEAWSFLHDHQARLNAALLRCAAGELVLAFGSGTWRRWKGVFLLTDRRFIFARHTGGAVTVVGDLDQFALDAKSGRLKSPDGVLTVSPRSPFTAPEIAELISHRDHPSTYIEMIGPGELAPARLPKATESATSTVEELERLDALHRSGAIDDDEFAELKRQLVWGDGGSTESSG